MHCTIKQKPVANVLQAGIFSTKTNATVKTYIHTPRTKNGNTVFNCHVLYTSHLHLF